jgi:hypothetical protein
MHFAQYPPDCTADGTFVVLIAPEEMLAETLEHELLQRRRVLFVCGNYSALLGRVGRRTPDFEVRRAFTVFQLLTVIGDADHSLVIVEHDRSAEGEEEEGVAEALACACAQRAREGGVLVLAAGFGPLVGTLAAAADRVVCIVREQIKQKKAAEQAAASQRTLAEW